MKLASPQSSNTIVIAMPVYNDWESVVMLLPAIDKALEKAPQRFSYEVLLIDDASVIPCPAELCEQPYSRIEKVSLLRLRCNLGHQRAIATGLSYLESKQLRALVLMDADGEDAPEIIPNLIEEMLRLGEKQIVFAERTLRAETLVFRFFYDVYRALHSVLTGMKIRVGNFSVIPAECLRSIVVVPDLWNHYAASVFRARIPHSSIPTRRAKRIRGHSHMNFISLVVHGLSALSVHGELMGVRLLVANGVVFLGLLVGLVGLMLALLTVGSRLPSWFYSVAALGLILMMQNIALSMFFAFIVLKSRADNSFIPLRDSVFYVSEVTVLTSGQPQVTSAVV